MYEINLANSRNILIKPKCVSLLAMELEEIECWNQAFKQIRKDYKRGFFCYKDVEKTVRELLEMKIGYTMFGPELMEGLVVSITSDILLGEGNLRGC